MPFYDYECHDCNFVENNRKASPDDTTIECPECGGRLSRLLHAQFGINMGAAGAYGYYDDNLGQYINTNRERKEVMQQQGVTEKGATPKNGGTWV